MISFASETRVFVSTQPIDFRRGVHGLVALVAEGLGNPYCGDIFVFRSKRRDRLKILMFDGTGMILATTICIHTASSFWSQVKVLARAAACSRAARRSTSVFHLLECFWGKSVSGRSYKL